MTLAATVAMYFLPCQSLLFFNWNFSSKSFFRSDWIWQSLNAPSLFVSECVFKLNREWNVRCLKPVGRLEGSLCEIRIVLPKFRF